MPFNITVREVNLIFILCTPLDRSMYPLGVPFFDKSWSRSYKPDGQTSDWPIVPVNSLAGLVSYSQERDFPMIINSQILHYCHCDRVVYMCMCTHALTHRHKLFLLFLMLEVLYICFYCLCKTSLTHTHISMCVYE